MKIKHLLLMTGLGLTSLIGLSSMTYVVDMTKQAVVTRMGEPIRMIVSTDINGKIEPQRKKRLEEWVKNYNAEKNTTVSIDYGAGLYFKMPFLDSVDEFEARALEYDSEPKTIVTRDKKRLVVDNYARWRIDNPFLFRNSVRSENGAQPKLDDIIYSAVREETGTQDLIEIVRTSNEPIKTEEERAVDAALLAAQEERERNLNSSGNNEKKEEERMLETVQRYEWAVIKTGREEILKATTKMSNEQAQLYGISVTDVRIRRADLPPENANNVFERMRQERSRIATQYRSEGEEEAIKITSDAEREKVEIESKAYQSAGLIKGEAEKTALETYAGAYGQDADFFRFLTTLRAYEKAFGEGKSKTVVLLPADSQFNSFLRTAGRSQ